MATPGRHHAHHQLTALHGLDERTPSIAHRVIERFFPHQTAGQRPAVPGADSLFLGRFFLGLSDAWTSPRPRRFLKDLADDYAYPAMVIDRILIDVQRAHGHEAVNQVIDACELTRRFGIRKVWPNSPRPTN
jgi:hypothetical protein